MKAVNALLAALLTLPGASWRAASQTDAAMQTLEPAIPIERALAGGQTHDYQLRLTAGQYLRVVVDQRGIDVMVTLVSPDGKKLAQVDSPNGARGPEVLSAMAELSGQFRLTVRALEEKAKPGRYELRIEELRAATAQDRERQAALLAYSEAKELHAIRTAESLRTAAEKYESARAFSHSTGDKRAEAEVLNLIGETHAELSDGKALGYYERALTLYKEIGDRRGEADSLNNIGQFYADKGENDQAAQFLELALPLQRLAGNHQGEMATLGNLGQLAYFLGEYQKALNLYEQALSLSRTLADRRSESLQLNGIGLAYTSLGDHARALENLEPALGIVRLLGERNGESVILGNIGLALWYSGDKKKAEQVFEQALPIVRAVGNPYSQAIALHNLGVVSAEIGEHQKALRYLQEALEARRASGDRRGEAVTLVSIGLAHVNLGDMQQGEECLTQALSIARQVSDPDAEAYALSKLASVERDRGRLVEARSHVETALVIAERLRAGVSTQELRASFLATIKNYYELEVGLLMQLHKNNPAEGFAALALGASERSRARSLLEMLRESRADIRRGVSAALLERERILSRQLDDTAERQISLLSGKHTEQQTAALRKALGELEGEYQRLQGEIRKSSPRYAALTQPQPLNLAEIQRDLLDGDTLVLEYLLGEKVSYLWAISPDSIRSFELPKREEIEGAARRLYDTLTARNRRIKGQSDEQHRIRIAERDSQYPEAAARLSELILKPVASWMDGKRLAVVADGALQYLPFGALPDPTSREYRPLVERHEVVVLPSASVLAILRQETAGRHPAPKHLAVLADPVFDIRDPRVSGRAAARVRDVALERAAMDVGALTDELRLPRLSFTRQEAEVIYRLAGSARGLKAVDFEANLRKATSPELSSFQIVHFATHGLLNTENAALSGLIFSLVDERGQTRDGFLKLKDIYNLDLPAELVVLSACQTGLGKEIHGEGLIGLTRGFMYAGAKRVVASLWKVDDVATAELMRRFYHGMMVEKERPAEALRKAQVSMRRQRRWSSPYYWAAFVLQGEWK